jgi:nocardicin N-oxygenase
MGANALGVGKASVPFTDRIARDAGAPAQSVDDLEFPLARPRTMGPPAEYGRLRATCPVAKLTVPPEFNATMWYVTRHADVQALLADPRLIRPTINEWPEVVGRPPDTGRPLVTMMEFDGPEHVALRRLVAEAFSGRAMQAYRPRMRATAERLLDEMACRPRPADIVRDYTEPFPLWIMCDLVGIPYEDRDHFLPLADAALGAMQTWEEGRKSTEQLYRYIGSVIKRKRRRPGDDILSRVIQESKAGAFGEDAVTAFGLSMLVAGYRTTTMFLGNSLVLLLSEPSRWALLREDRARLPGAVEELLRFIPVMNGIVVLQAVEDIELHGRLIRRGDAVLPVIAAANRDETAFADPDELNLGRVDNPHVGFGRGGHNCVAAALARMEMAVGLEALLDRFPDLRLADGRAATWNDTAPAKSPLTLHVDW